MVDLSTHLVVSTNSGSGGKDASLADIVKGNSGDGTKFLAGDATFKTPSGGGGGASIEPESGSSPIKISAFPDAAAPMAAADRVTGLQGGANVNFSQAQILAGVDGVSGGGGTTIFLHGGRGDGVGTGADAGCNGGDNGADATSQAGGAFLNGGSGNGSGANGGRVGCYAGNSTSGNGGSAYFYSGNSSSGNGGNTYVMGGNGTGATFQGGNVIIKPGIGNSGAINGWFYVKNIPSQATSAGVPAGAIWVNSATNVLTVA
jgi:hypothetical protein